MSGLFGVMSVANSGMVVQTRNIRTAGHNISNVDNPDYTRQRAVVATRTPFVTQAGSIGTGVEQVTIERIQDHFIEARLRGHLGGKGSADVQAQALSLIEEVFNEQNGPGLAADLDEFYRAFADLAASSSPGAPAERTAVLAAAERLVQTIRTLDGQLREQYEATNFAIETRIPRVNELTATIDRLNDKIVATEITAPANDLRDARDAAVRELSTLLDVQILERDSGALSVALSNGMPLVEGDAVYQLEAAPGGIPDLGIDEMHVYWRGDGGSIDVSDEIGGGEVGGLLRVRETTLPSAIRSLDSVAYNLAASVNAVHNLGTGLDGSTGDFFVQPAQVENAARDLAIDAAIVANTDAIAAGTTSAPGDNRNAAALAELRNSSAGIFLPGDPPGPASGPDRTLLEHVSAIAIDVGEQARNHAYEQASQERILEDLQNRRDEVSGVSLDEELAGLIQMQAAFQANARVIRLVDDLLNDLLSIL